MPPHYPLLERMQMSELTQDRLKELLHYDPETGLFTRVSSGKPVGCPNAGSYLQIRIAPGRRRYLAHRLAFMYMTGAWPTEQVDHINHRRSDNRWVNLRAVSHAENQHNRSGTRGTTHRNRPGITKTWQARIRVGVRTISLGMYHTEPEAHAAYLAAKRIYHPSAPQ